MPSPEPPIAFAHRGGQGPEPESTLAAFRRALAAGATGLEADVRLSSDGEVVLGHAPRRRSGIVWRQVRATTAERLAHAGVPSLDELYRELGTAFELSLDLKVTAAASRVLAVASDHGARSRLWICSGDLAALRELRAVAPDVHLVHTTSARGAGGSLERHAADLAAAGVDAVNLRHSEWSAGLIALFHRFDVRAFAWDAQHDHQLRAMVRLGVDAIYSDHVERMLAAIRARSS